MPTVFTAQSVARMKPDPRKRLEVPDAALPGFYLIIQPTGVKSWAVRYRRGAQQRKLTIGRYPVFDLVEARSRAREAMQAVATGRDPCTEKRETRQVVRAATPDRDLVSAQVEMFLARHVRQKLRASSATQVEQRFRKHVLPQWGTRRVREIARRDVIELLDGILDGGAPISANRTLATLKTFFSWLVDRSVIETSPCARVKPPAAETSRDRVLSNDELRLVWRATERLGGPYGGFVQMLVLTGQRREEAAAMRRSEIQGDVWTLEADRTKSGVAHDVPLTAPALQVVEMMPANGDFVFTFTGDAPLRSYGRAKQKLDAALLAVAESENATPPAHWTFHDLRRTAASGMARLGMPVHVIEAVLAHRGGEVSGVAAVYNRHSYLPEKRRALEAWAGHVMQLAGDPPASNVRAFRR
jgi:integrase